jgi:hypothetical protein
MDNLSKPPHIAPRAAAHALGAATLWIAILAARGYAAGYNEYVAGDLPENGLAPFTLTLEAGANLLVAQSSSVDPDFLRLIVPAGLVLDAIIVEFHSDPNQVFLGLQSGPVWTAGSSGEIDPSQLLGWVDFPTDPLGSHIGEDLLDDLAVAAGASGFVPPLGSGAYTVLLQTQSSTIGYSLAFNLSSGSETLPGDFNEDDLVDRADLAQWRTQFGLGLDGNDLLAWQRSFGYRAPAAIALPEPAPLLSALSLLAIIVAARNSRFPLPARP